MWALLSRARGNLKQRAAWVRSLSIVLKHSPEEVRLCFMVCGSSPGIEKPDDSHRLSDVSVSDVIRIELLVGIILLELSIL